MLGQEPILFYIFANINCLVITTYFTMCYVLRVTYYVLTRFYFYLRIIHNDTVYWNIPCWFCQRVFNDIFSMLKKLHVMWFLFYFQNFPVYLICLSIWYFTDAITLVRVLKGSSDVALLPSSLKKLDVTTHGFDGSWNHFIVLTWTNTPVENIDKFERAFGRNSTQFWGLFRVPEDPSQDCTSVWQALSGTQFLHGNVPVPFLWRQML